LHSNLLISDWQASISGAEVQVKFVLRKAVSVVRSFKCEASFLPRWNGFTLLYVTGAIPITQGNGTFKLPSESEIKHQRDQVELARAQQS
jgi:hypothetical protein